MEIRITVLQGALVAAALLGAADIRAVEKPAAPATLDELQSAVAAVVEEDDLPSVGIAMVDRNGPVWVGAIGQANLESGKAADENALYRIGSTSKMFIALAVLKLVEEGRLSLDDRLAELAPEIVFENPWEETDPVRIVHLLEHTTGWDDIHLAEYAHNDPTPASLKQGLDFHPHSRKSRWVPGSRMSYCNSGPPVAAYVVEKVTGQDFEEYVAAILFEPMGMESMTYRYNEDVRERGVTSYANGNQPQEYWHIIMRPSGSINATPADMARLAGFYLNSGAVYGRPLISPESLSRMETPASTPAAKAGQEAGYGLNNYSSSFRQWVYREHNGGVSGGLTELAYLPEAGVGHAIMVNSDNGAAFRRISNLVRGFETRSLEEKEIGPDQPLSALNRSIEGFYHPVNPRQQVAYFLERVFNVQKFWFESGRLARKGLLGGETKYYYPASDTLWKSADTGQLVLAQTADPIMGEVVHVGTAVLKPVSGAIVFLQLGIAAIWGVMIATSILFVPVWGVRRLRGKIPPGVAIRVRLWPLLAAVSALAVAVLFSAGMSDPFRLLGAPTLISLGVMIFTIAFAGFAVLGAWSALAHRGSGMNRAAWGHSALASAVHVVVAAYLFSFGVIGLMTWA